MGEGQGGVIPIEMGPIEMGPIEMGPIEIGAWRSQFEAELVDNILPFWMEVAVDPDRGGFVGAVTNDRQVLNEVPCSGVVCARILWTYSAAYRRYGGRAYRKMAQRAYAYLTGPFWDALHAGVYWQIDAEGQVVSARKHSYAQAFAIYGLSEYYRAVGDVQALELAQVLFWRLEDHAHDYVYGGYVEGCGPAWDALADMRLSDKEPHCRKSMNTLLHVLEGYTNLLRVWDNLRLRSRLRELLDIFVGHVIDSQTNHFRLFFDDAWGELPGHISDGHDIEGSWLLMEAAEVLGDPVLVARMRQFAVRIANAVYAGGLAADGSIVYERQADGAADPHKHWWVQAEGVVGFTNAWQVGGDARFLAAAQGCWRVIQEQFLDRTHGDWFKVLDAQGVPVAGQVKVGPWECPYHHGRMCLEMVERLGHPAPALSLT